MLLAGDELGHSQGGNNNAYCHDSEMTWLDWTRDEKQSALLAFTQSVIALRKLHPVFQRQKFFQGRAIRDEQTRDIQWFSPDGQEMTDEAWNAGFVRCLGLFLGGKMSGEVDFQGEPIEGESLLLLLNAHHEAIPFKLPSLTDGTHWVGLLDTDQLPAGADSLRPGSEYDLSGRSLAVLRWQGPVDDEEAAEPAEHFAPEILAAVNNAQPEPRAKETASGATVLGT